MTAWKADARQSQSKHGYPWHWQWARTSRWNVYRYYVRRQRWFRGDEVYNPFEYQTDEQRALDALKEACDK